MHRFSRFVRYGALAALAVAASMLAPVGPAPAAGEDWVSLFNGQDLSGWRTFVAPEAKDADPAAIWTVSDGVIHCAGKPAGYIITVDEYSNYELQFEWRWPGKTGNSGCFVHVVGPDKIWPKGVEAQLMADHAGDFWLVDGAKLTIDPARQDPGTPRHYFRTADGVEKPAGQWNKYRIVCQGDTITLFINDKQVNQGTDSELTKGKILLQSEGAEIEFRNIRLKPL